MIRPIVHYGDPVLRQMGTKITEVTEEIRQLAADMIDTMRAANGVGLAAHQVGVPVQMCVIDAGPHFTQDQGLPGWPLPTVLLNPFIQLSEEKESGGEGCLSFPGIDIVVPRSAYVHVTADALDGTRVGIHVRGFAARVLQHEIDHLNGTLFIDRLTRRGRNALSAKLEYFLR